MSEPISYVEAASQLGIPEGDTSGFARFVSEFEEGLTAEGLLPDRMLQHLTEDYLAGDSYQGSLLERRVLEARLSVGLPPVEAAAVASRLAANPSSPDDYGLLAHVLRVQILYSPGEWLLREQLALVMGVPDEDRRAFYEVILNYLDNDEDWRAQIAGRLVDLDQEPIPRAMLDDFWDTYEPSQAYRGSDLEGEVLAERAGRATTLTEIRCVLSRMTDHVLARPDLMVREIRGWFTCIAEALHHPDIEGKPSVEPLKAVA